MDFISAHWQHLLPVLILVIAFVILQNRGGQKKQKAPGKAKRSEGKDVDFESDQESN
ncbi:MAG: hypothetical protein IJ705_02340 [Oscillospiraceae bacterium]|nr:hypothetical protein [Oscillospiraceae bacterium]